MSEIFVFGIDGSGLCDNYRELLKSCKLIVTSKRLAAYASDLQAEMIPVTPLKDGLSKIGKALEKGNVGLLASGDPLLYGVGSTILEHFEADRVRIYPALSSLQEAFARFKMTWSDSSIVSLHGRKEPHIAGILLCRRKTFIFTDRAHPPEFIAAAILHYLDSIGDTTITQGCRVFVAENLGCKNENITTGSLAEIRTMHFADLNVVCLLLPELPPRPTFGLHEDQISHSRGLITKSEIRAATLHRLHLPRKGVFWDIGGGSGSISAEAAAMYPKLNIYTVERKKEEIENIKENIRRFSLFNINPVSGRASGLLSGLPDPDRVFIGGSGGELQQLIHSAAQRLQEGGRLVVNGVTDKTVERTPSLMEACGLRVETSQITVSRSGPSGPRQFNPISIMVGHK